MRTFQIAFAIFISILSAAADEKPLPPGAVRIGTPEAGAQRGASGRAFLDGDGKTIISTAGDKSLEFRNPTTGDRIHEMKFGEVYFNDADLARDAGLLALTGWYRPSDTGRNESVLWLINTKSKSIEWTLPLGPQVTTSYKFLRMSADGKRLYGASGNLIQVWDAADGQEVAKYAPKAQGLDAFAVSPDGKTVAFGRYDLFLWRWESDDEPTKLASIGGAGTALIEFVRDGKTLFVERDGLILNIEVPSGKQVGAWKAGGTLRTWSLSPDGKTLAVATRWSMSPGKQFVVLHNAATGVEQCRFDIGIDYPAHLSWSGDGQRLSAITNHRILVWDVAAKQRLSPEPVGHEGNITALAFTGDGRLFTASDDHSIRSWSAAGKPGLKLEHKHWVRGLALSPDDSLVAGSALRNDLRVWDVKTGAEKYKLLGNGEMGGKRLVRFTPDSGRLISWGDDHYLRVWDMKNGKLLSENLVLPDGVKESELDDPFRESMIVLRTAMAPTGISPNGETMVIADGRNLRFIVVASGQEQRRFQPSSESILGIAYSADGNRLAIAVKGPAGEIEMPDGSTKKLESSACSVGVWDVAKQKPIWKDAAPSVPLARLAFSLNGSQLAMSTDGHNIDRAILLWDAASGAKLGRIDIPTTGRALTFDRTGQRLAVALTDTTAIVFNVKTALKPEASK